MIGRLTAPPTISREAGLSADMIEALRFDGYWQ